MPNLIFVKATVTDLHTPSRVFLTVRQRITGPDCKNINLSQPYGIGYLKESYNKFQMRGYREAGTS